jgi:hypothetical protein
MARWSPKDPNDIADYWFDWGSDAQPVKERFLPAGETITAATVTVPDGLTKVESDFTNKTVRVRLSFGAVGLYEVTCLITTSAGQEFEMTSILQVADRKKG